MWLVGVLITFSDHRTDAHRSASPSHRHPIVLIITVGYCTKRRSTILLYRTKLKGDIHTITMRLAAAFVLMAGSAAAFAPAQQAGARRTALASTLEYEAIIGSGSSISADDFNAKLAANRESMSAKDKTSKSLGKGVSIFPSTIFLIYVMCTFHSFVDADIRRQRRKLHRSCVRCEIGGWT